jgi:1-deoxy-D-xylulose-5-phosphate synthase
MNYDEVKQLCLDIRREIMGVVSKNGGHLASNLGSVELTVAIHRNFNSPKDKIIFDVGHQCYTHKILTGREFSKLRQKNGISGFPNPKESEHDPFISGHSSTAVSVAGGFATAMRLDKNTDNYAIAVVGDGAMTGGLFYEGLNNAGQNKRNNIIVILNHNGVSISKNVGAIAKYLTKIRHNENYVLYKKALEEVLDRTPVFGKPLIRILKTSKDMVKEFVHLTNMFENMGFVYLGPVDGHNVEELDKVLQTAKSYKHPVFIHVNTVKGKGYKFAEENPGEYHGVSQFNAKIGTADSWKKDCFSTAFGESLVSFARLDKRICAISAGMKYGTGLQDFAHEFPDRFFDVGIAESHAVTFAAALAKSGKIPVFAVYSSFLQRCYDQLIHDVSISDLHVVLAIDRAGIVGEDGETHQGIFDINMLLTIPNITIYSPQNYENLQEDLYEAIYKCKGIVAVRYPRGKEILPKYDDNPYKRKDTVVLTYGRLCTELEPHISCICFDPVYPFETFEILPEISKCKNIVFVEECYEIGGLADRAEIEYRKQGWRGNFYKIAVPGFVKQGTVKEIWNDLGLNWESVKDFCIKLP